MSATARSFAGRRPDPARTVLRGAFALPTRWTWALLAICLLGLVPRLWIGTHNAIEYDGWWHIFNAQQDRWSNFVAAARGDAHPPLYLFLLRLSILLLGRTPLVYRAVSIAAGTASIFLVGVTARRVTSHPALGLIAALAFALSDGAIEMSCEARSYALAILLVLLAFDALQRLLSGACIRPARDLCVFSVAGTLALWSHYYAAFFLGACAVIGTLRVLIDPQLAARMSHLSLRERLGCAASVVPILGSGAFLYQFHGKEWVTTLSHLPGFYFRPGGGESVGAFLLRTIQAEVNLFSPLRVPGGTALVLALIAVVLVFVVVPLALAMRGDSHALAQATPFAFVTLQAGALAAAAVLGAYPFGGWFRHQSILFPFIVIAAIVVVDGVLVVSSRPWVRAAACAALTAGILANLAHQVPRLASFPGEDDWGKPFPLQGKLSGLTAVYADTYSSISLFSNLDRCSWRYVDGPRKGLGIQRYDVACGGDRIFVMQDQATWNADLASMRLYRDLHDDLARRRIYSVVIYFVDQFSAAGSRSPVEQQTFEARITSASAEAGLAADRIVVTGRKVLVRLLAAPAAVPASTR